MNANSTYGRIYLITCRTSGKKYVGQTTVTLEERWRKHQRKNSGCRLLAKAIRKYGVESFDLIEIDTAVSKVELSEKECAWIVKLGTQVPHGYNLDAGGKGGLHSRETVSRIRESRYRLFAERLAQGKALGPSPLTETQVREIHTMYQGGTSVGVIARHFGVDRSTVSFILSGKNWAHVYAELEAKGLLVRRRVQRLTRDAVRHAHGMYYRDGLPAHEIAAMLGITEGGLWGTLSGKTYPDIYEEIHGHKPSGHRTPRHVKVTPDQHAWAVQARANGQTFSTIAAHLGVTVDTAYRHAVGISGVEAGL